MNQVGNIEIIEAESDFKKVHKNIINNHSIDCLTLGVFVRILTLGKKWKLNINGLSSHLGISDKKTRDAIKLLESFGFVTRYPVKDIETGKFKGWNYKFHAIPVAEEDKTSAGQRTYPKPDTPLNGQGGYPTRRLSDKAETGGDINSRPKELLDLKNSKPKQDNHICDFSKFISEFNELRGSRFRELDKVRKQYCSRINDGYSQEDMINALKIAMKQKNHIDTKYKYLTPEFITRSDKLDMFLNMGNDIQSKNVERNYDEEF